MFTPPRANADIHAALTSILDMALDSAVEVMLDDPDFPERNKSGLRMIKANREMKHALGELIRLANPELDTTDALLDVRAEITAFLSRTLDEAKSLIERHSALIDKSKEL